MADVRCPKCGKSTTVRTVKKTGQKYYVCVNYPECLGRFAVPAPRASGDGKAAARTSKGGPAKRGAPASASRPQRKAAPTFTEWGDDWGGVQSPKPVPPRESLFQKKEPPKPESLPREKEPARPQPRLEKPVRRPLKDKGPLASGIKHLDVHEEYNIDEVWGDEEVPDGAGLKPPPARPRRRPASVPEAAPEAESHRSRKQIFHRKEELHSEPKPKAKEPPTYQAQYKRGPKPSPVPLHEPERPKPAPYRPQYQKPPRWEAEPESGGQAEPGGEARTGPYRSQYRRRPQPSPELPYDREPPKPAPYQPQYKKAPRWGAEPEAGGTPGSGGWGEDTSAAYRPQYRRGPRPAAVGPQGVDEMRSAPYRPQYPRAERRGTSYETRKPSKQRRHKAPPTSDEEPRAGQSSKKPFLPLYKREPKKYEPPVRHEQSVPQRHEPSERRPFHPLYKKTPKQYAPPDDGFYPPHQQPMAPPADTGPVISEHPKPWERRVPQELLAPPPGKKRNMPVIIIALIIAFLAIDGMIYAAFVMRNQGGSSPTPTPTAMSYQQDVSGIDIISYIAQV